MRTLVALGAIEVLVLAGLAGSAHPVEATACLTDPAVAASVGEVTITEAEVDAAVAQVRDGLEDLVAQNLPDAGAAEREQELAVRVEAEHHAVVERQVLTEATLSYAADGRLTLPPPDPGATAAAYALSTESDYVRVIAEYEAVMAGLEGAVVAPAVPTEADQREVYDNLVAQGLTEVPFEQVRPLLDQELIGGPVALRNLIAVVVGEADLCVSPRYQLAHRVPVPIGGEQSWLSVPIGETG